MPFIFLFFFSSIMNAQVELVNNGSFEIQSSCPTIGNQVYKAIGWDNYGGGGPFFTASPDLFDTCLLSPVWGVPYNYFGSQFPADGHAYCGIFTYACNYQYREFIGSKLLEVLIPGHTYHLSFKTVKADTPAYDIAANHIGMKFSIMPHDSINSAPLDNIVQLYSDTIITDTLEWTFLSSDWIADSAYQYVMIGNFYDDAHTDTMQFSEFSCWAYYYIDAISVKKNFGDGVEDYSVQQFNVQLSSGSLIIYLYADADEIIVSNLIGQTYYNVKANYKQHQTVKLKLENFGKGMYLIMVKNKGGFFIQKILQQN